MSRGASEKQTDVAVASRLQELPAVGAPVRPDPHMAAARHLHGKIGALLEDLAAGTQVHTCESWTRGGTVFLFPEEAHLVARASEKRRNEFSAGRMCAHMALDAAGAARAPLLRNADRTAAWPVGIVGSITHSGDYAAAAVGRASRHLGIGIDAEQIGAVGRELWPSLFTEAEQALLAGSATPDVLSSTLFSAKEAFYKCQFAFTRQWLDFTDVEVTFGPDVGFTARVRCGDRRDIPGLSGRYRTGDGLVLTAVLAPAASIGAAPASGRRQ